MAHSLADQVVIVTGGGRGIGRAICLALAKAGANVAVLDRLESEAVDTASLLGESSRGLPLVGDVSDAAFVEAAVARTVAAFGRLTGIVNNAGLGGLEPIASSDPARWWKVVEVNLKGPYLLARFGLPVMIANGGGRIVSVASEAGLEGRANASAYSASKGAVILMTESIARETAANNVCAFAMHPGGVLTPGSGAGLRPGSPLPEAMKAEIRELLCDPPELAAELCVRLLSGEADALSGSYISVHDDLAALVGQAAHLVEAGSQRLRLRTAAAS